MNVASIKTSKQVITTHNADVLCINYQDVKGLAPCTHKEANTRILLHLEDAVQQGHNKMSIRTVDTDVVVLAITSAQDECSLCRGETIYSPAFLSKKLFPCLIY